jgi:hypothetical protein
MIYNKKKMRRGHSSWLQQRAPPLRSYSVEGWARVSTTWAGLHGQEDCRHIKTGREDSAAHAAALNDAPVDTAVPHPSGAGDTKCAGG